MGKFLRGLFLLALAGAALGAVAWYLTGRRRKPESFAPPAAPPSHTAPIQSYAPAATAPPPVEPESAPVPAEDTPPSVAEPAPEVVVAATESAAPPGQGSPSYITTYPTPEVRSFFVEQEPPAPVAVPPAPANVAAASALPASDPEPEDSAVLDAGAEPAAPPPSYITTYPTPTVRSFFVEQDAPSVAEAAEPVAGSSVLITTFAVPDTVVISLVAPAPLTEPAVADPPEATPEPVAAATESPAELDEGANHLLDAFTRYAESTEEDDIVEPAEVAEAVEPEAEPAPAVSTVPDGATARTADAHLDEGNVYFNVGQYILAIECYSSAIDLQPDLIAAYYNRANARTRLGHYGQALADYDRALELEPNDADALNNRGMLHLYRSDYASAIRDFEVALSIDPGDTTIMVNRGLAYLHSGNGAAALVDFEAAAAADPGDAAAYYGCAQATATLGDRDVAMRHLTRAFELDPAYVREAAADPKLASLQGDPDFLKLLRDTGGRAS